MDVRVAYDHMGIICGDVYHRPILSDVKVQRPVS